MYHSLIRTGEQFRLYIYCFDQLSHDILSRLKLKNVVLIALSEFESGKLKAVKETRSFTEYCWTCTPHVIRHNLETFSLPVTTYVDADVYFYDKPDILNAELRCSESSVLITKHRYTPVYDQSLTSGIYCVQFMTFKGDRTGTEILDWWQQRCLEWCYARFEDGKFGDQKYLDDWTERFAGVHVLEHLGGGVAPWNVQQYSVRKVGNRITVNNIAVVFYHFHNYAYFSNGVHDYGIYKLQDEVIELFYRPYSALLEQIEKEIRSVEPGFDRGRSKIAFKSVIKNIIRRARGTYNARKGVCDEHRSDPILLNSGTTRNP